MQISSLKNSDNEENITSVIFIIIDSPSYFVRQLSSLEKFPVQYHCVLPNSALFYKTKEC